MPVVCDVPRVNILGTYIHNITRPQARGYLERMIASGEPHVVTSPNVDHVVQARQDAEFRAILNSADLTIPEGMGVVYASHLLGTPLKGNVGARPLVLEMCALASQRGLRAYLLGAKPVVVKEAAVRLQQRYAGLEISGMQHGYFSSDEEEGVVKAVRCSRSDMLITALGTPKQERFIARYKYELGVPVMIGVGATLNFISGHLSLPPEWMTRVGAEWLYRTFQEPRRLGRRYLLDDPVFFWWVIQQRLSRRSVKQSPETMIRGSRSLDRMPPWQDALAGISGGVQPECNGGIGTGGVVRRW